MNSCFSEDKLQGLVFLVGVGFDTCQANLNNIFLGELSIRGLMPVRVLRHKSAGKHPAVVITKRTPGLSMSYLLFLL